MADEKLPVQVFDRERCVVPAAVTRSPMDPRTVMAFTLAMMAAVLILFVALGVVLGERARGLGRSEGK